MASQNHSEELSLDSELMLSDWLKLITLFLCTNQKSSFFLDFKLKHTLKLLIILLYVKKEINTFDWRITISD